MQAIKRAITVNIFQKQTVFRLVKIKYLIPKRFISRKVFKCSNNESEQKIKFIEKTLENNYIKCYSLTLIVNIFGYYITALELYTTLPAGGKKTCLCMVKNM